MMRGEEVYGVFELLADRPHAFEERDFVALQRLAEMIQTAVELAEAARRAEKELGGKPEPAILSSVTTEPQAAHQTLAPEIWTELKAEAESGSALEDAPGFATGPLHAETTEVELQEEFDEPLRIEPTELGAVGTCEACAFPVSPGRRLCLDCEAIAPQMDLGDAPEFPGELAISNQSWARSHVYLIATVLTVAATIVVLIWRF